MYDKLIIFLLIIFVIIIIATKIYYHNKLVIQENYFMILDKIKRVDGINLLFGEIDKLIDSIKYDLKIKENENRHFCTIITICDNYERTTPEKYNIGVSHNSDEKLSLLLNKINPRIFFYCIEPDPYGCLDYTYNKIKMNYYNISRLTSIHKSLRNISYFGKSYTDRKYNINHLSVGEDGTVYLNITVEIE